MSPDRAHSTTWEIKEPRRPHARARGPSARRGRCLLGIAGSDASPSGDASYGVDGQGSGNNGPLKVLFLNLTPQPALLSWADEGGRSVASFISAHSVRPWTTSPWRFQMEPSALLVPNRKKMMVPRMSGETRLKPISAIAKMLSGILR